MIGQSRRIRGILPYGISILLVLLIVLFAIRYGSVMIPLETVVLTLLQEGFGVPLGVELEASHVQIILHVRLPRIVLALLVGAALALAGAAFQGLLRNPLADPFTLGVSSGSALGAVTVLFFHLSFLGTLTLPFVSILSGFATLLFVIAFTRLVQRSLANETIILTGIIISSFLGAWLSLLVAFSQEDLRQIISWLMGSVGMRGWSHVWIMLPFFVIGVTLLLTTRRELNAFIYGEETAQQLGVSVTLKKFIILVGATCLTGAAVAVSGTIGFVGLVVPHMVRSLWGGDHRHLLPLSAILGAGFLVIADLTARTIVSPAEVPIGVVTALVGSPLFGWMLYRQYRTKKG
ncbi:vitamin B12 ABC transporter, permease component BtuC [Bacillus sp. JCM 19046]|nr:vitamin B12 ABC transporter, permease component BtuC [Bacillus sp. JCM 19045]GAF17928.1 vitamin B12 ABC transporter, permease component BtuC [Bacillus sp. JCM 19046]